MVVTFEGDSTPQINRTTGELIGECFDDDDNNHINYHTDYNKV